jgi:hypothetical protein
MLGTLLALEPTLGHWRASALGFVLIVVSVNKERDGAGRSAPKEWV